MCIRDSYRVGLDQGSRPLGHIGLLTSFPYLYCIYTGSLGAAFFILCAASIMILATGLLLFEKGRATALHVSTALSGLIYPLALSSFWVLLRNDIDGRFWMIFGLVCTFGADTGAYYMGKNFGRKRIAPLLSPKKTLEGLYGGMLASTLLGTGFYYLFNLYAPLEKPCALLLVAFMALSISILDLIGDLSASMYKRHFQVKDMGNLIPGHGGMLDRMDGIMPVGVLLYLTLHSAMEAAIVMLSVLYAMAGGVILQKLLGYNFSVAVWVGYIALYGVAVQTGVVMVIYLHEALEHHLAQGKISEDDVYQATREGAVLRLRPKLMTVSVVLASLLPIMWSSGVGSDVMKPIATPIIGGMVASTIHVLIITPLIFVLMKRQAVRRGTLKALEK